MANPRERFQTNMLIVCNDPTMIIYNVKLQVALAKAVAAIEILLGLLPLHINVKGMGNGQHTDCTIRQFTIRCPM